MITAKNLTRRFGPLLAVDDLSFEIERGEVVGFLGPNGAGKTTTLRILAGFLPASSGSATIAGFDVLRKSLEVRKHIGYLAETVPLYGEHRVDEMLDFQGRLHGLSRKERKERIPVVLDKVGVLDRRRQLVGQLSRGLRQRVGLATALLPNPDVLILDEPTSGLDPLQRIEVRKLIEDLAGQHTVLVSSHILPEIEAVCPRVIILSHGRLAADGTQEKLVRTLGGASFVRIEIKGGAALCGPGIVGPIGLLRNLKGVHRVEQRRNNPESLEFDVVCDVDLRVEIGELAQREDWTLRELSWRKATLEELFARIALDLNQESAEVSA
ncbi:MAG: ABC-2 type transport system ATP-binding protein [Planctomycetota bacterium]